MMYRAHFQDDFLIDLVGYRRHGHNEGDEPAYTQPLKYKRIAAHPTAGTIYADQLESEGVCSAAQTQTMHEEIASRLREAQDQVRDYEPVGDDGPDDEREVPVLPKSTGVDL